MTGLSDISAVEIAAPLVSLLALVLFVRALRGPRTRRWLGPPADFWELLRRWALPLVDRLARRRLPGDHYAAYELDKREVVGVIDAPPEAVERELWAAGARRMPLAAFKTLPDGRREVGSWAFRRGLLATHQTHIMLFAAGDGKQTTVAAHAEHNALNPLVADKHYRGVGYDPVAGADVVRGRLEHMEWARSHV